MHGTSLARAVLGAALLFTSAACGDSPTYAGVNGPSAYVTVALAHENGVLDSARATGTALIVDAMLPYDVFYRKVDDFRMTRRADGAAFDWEERIPGPKSAKSNTFSSTPHWALRWSGREGRLGLRDVVPGDTLDFEIETGNRTVVATLVVPGVPRLSYSDAGGAGVVRWQRVSGAAYYEVFAPSESNESIYTSDSSLVINNSQGHSSPATVTAQVHDASTARRRLNAFSFPQSQDGVRYQFAAISSDRITLPQ